MNTQNRRIIGSALVTQQTSLPDSVRTQKYNPALSGKMTAKCHLLEVPAEEEKAMMQQ